MTMNGNQSKSESFNPSDCGKIGTKTCRGCKYCCIPTESCIHTRRCFMSGEYCSQQSNIQREREKLYAENSIRAFVIMNFSDMSDVVYEWRIKSFVKSLSSYLYFDKQHQRLYCSSIADDSKWDKDKMVKNIEVVRSDSDPASNYVVCNRICQQLQIADLVIVDVSSQNANVFYEFGMAVALGKMILPICYSESFYKMTIPEKLKDRYWKLDKAEDKSGDIAHHIGLFPWRKDLFEYYGIRYKGIKSNKVSVEASEKNENANNRTRYATYDIAVDPENGFSDMKYARFPYHEVISRPNDKTIEESKKTIGQEIYDKLSQEYNDAKADDNTLIVYTMDSFLNKEQAGQCIVNFYRNITARMNQEKCFRGERVGVLVQENVIPENEKDAKEHIDIFYNIGEIIQIGTNQATYLAAEEKIYSNDDFSDLEEIDQENITEQGIEQRRNIERFVKEHSKNRAMRIYPNNPVFVDRMKNLLHKDVLETGEIETGQSGQCCNLDSFCLYHVMLRTLRYTNEIVVDISDNCLQSLFWLGAAHGSDIYAITVIHEKTDMERTHTRGADVEKDEKVNRNVFDVSGLWIAILKKYDTAGFYQQLAAAQSGIERHSKLMLDNNTNTSYKQKMKELLFPGSGAVLCQQKQGKAFKKLLHQKNKEEREKMESYYRDRFWKPLLCYNQLCIYLSQMNEKGNNDQEPRLCMSKWDYDAVSVFSNYLSKRKVIGEYLLISLPSGRIKAEIELDSLKTNYVCVGSDVYPLGKSLPKYISEQINSQSSEYDGVSGINIVHEKWTVSKSEEKSGDKECKEQDRVFKGFMRIGNAGKGILTHHPKTQKCINCIRLKENADNQKADEKRVIYSSNDILGEKCQLVKNGMHCEIAQLILWREEPQNSHDRDYFWVGIAGSSGPATEALSMLFVKKEQRKFQQDSDDDYWLYDLQEVVRKKVMEVFFLKLRKRLKEVEMEFCDEIGRRTASSGDEQKRRYFALVEHAVSSYLSTVFYRYFFPLLSEKDIDRICNGMYTFVNSMKAAKISPFAIDYHSNRDREYSSFVSNESIEKIVDEVPKVLRATLKSFRGLEAFYNVTVHHCLEKNDENEDTREIVGIERLSDNNDKFSSVNCFFV